MNKKTQRKHKQHKQPGKYFPFKDKDEALRYYKEYKEQNKEKIAASMLDYLKQNSSVRAFYWRAAVPKHNVVTRSISKIILTPPEFK